MKFIENLKKMLFGKRNAQPESKKLPNALDETPILPKRPNIAASVSRRTEPYFIQIGFDFGTSYSKCTCRDIMTNKAWIHFHRGSRKKEMPFLIPSTLSVKNGKISHVKDYENQYPEKGLYHLKNALVKATLDEWESPFLEPYLRILESSDKKAFSRHIESCAVYFMGGVLGDVRSEIRRRFPDFGDLPEDYVAVNLAVPVEEAEQRTVIEVYERIIREAWAMTDELSGFPAVSLNELELMRKQNEESLNQSMEDNCFIYPEVSANVQGFVRSRVSSPGTYLFSDTGGGSVDQSIFIFYRQNGEDYLTYLSGRVLPLGSSHIEHFAAQNAGSVDWKSLELWRFRKESGENLRELREAKSKISDKLRRGTERTITLARKKLFVKEQLEEIKVIFGGGGHCEHPYKQGVMRAFTGNLFAKSLSPDVIGLPVPRDLDIEGNPGRWMRRLTVAYGLSFEKSELARFTFPKDVHDPKPEEIWRPEKRIRHAPIKEEC